MASKRQKASAKALQKKRSMYTPGEQSKYAKKRQFLIRNGGRGIDYPDKPWK